MAGNAAQGSHRERMLRAGNALFYDRGYHGTSVDAILAEAGSPKGSFYHHFGSKDTFGHAVLDGYTAGRRHLLERWLDRSDLGIIDRIVGYHRDLVERFERTGSRRACLAGKLSNELAADSEDFRAQLAAAFAATRDLLAEQLADAQARGEVTEAQSPVALADAIQIIIQGGFVVALALRDRRGLDDVTVALDDLLRAAR